MIGSRLRLGFTIVELMVAVTIISILAVMVYANFADSRAKARDAERQSDIRLLQNAIELYKVKYGRYPEGCQGANNWSGGAYGCPSGFEYIIGIAPEFISVLPRDPRPGTGEGYVYVTDADGSVFKLMAMNTVETEKVHYCSEFASCDVRNPTLTYVSNASVLSGFSDCVKVAPHPSLPNGAATYRPNTSSINPELYGWCTQVDTNQGGGQTIDSNVTRCRMNSSPFTDNGNGRFEKSYGVWGGIADLKGGQLLNNYEDTTDIVCK